MREIELEKSIQQAINDTEVGKKVALNFSGDPHIIDVKLKFKGGWEVTQTVIPGRMFEFTKGEGDLLLGIDISITPFSGLAGA
ncbi:hypothetical protein KUL118_67700 [Tenacibaculum sp. KUL118]|nr:hypothetical protein KUL118_67700 [Tenacibaculum sp. KUL118]